MALHFLWERRVQTGQTAPALRWRRSECWQCQRRKAIARSFVRRRPTPAEPHRAGFDCPMLPTKARHPCFVRGRCAAPAKQFRTAPKSAHGRTHRAAQASARCSGCEQRLAPHPFWHLSSSPRGASSQTGPSVYTRARGTYEQAPVRLGVAFRYMPTVRKGRRRLLGADTL
jgi:hypothetical protein